jgi:hypothetical protein
VTRLKHSIVWCLNLDTSKNRSEVPGNYEMLCWRRMKKISWTDRVRNEEVLLRVSEQRNILHTIKIRLIVLVTSCVGIVFHSTLSKER